MTYSKFNGNINLKEMAKNADIDLDYSFEIDISSMPADDVRIHLIKYCNMVQQGLL